MKTRIGRIQVEVDIPETGIRYSPEEKWIETDAEVDAEVPSGFHYGSRIRLGCYVDGTENDHQAWSLEMEGARLLAAVCTTEHTTETDPGFFRFAFPELCADLGRQIRDALVEAWERQETLNETDRVTIHE